MSLELEEQFYETERARLQRWVPWVHLFRAFRLATRWQNLALAFAGVLLLSGGRGLLTYAPFSAPVPPGIVAGQRTVWPWQREFLAPPLPSIREATFGHALAHPLETLDLAASRGPTVLAPLADFLQPARVLFHRHNSWAQVADAWLHVLLVVALGSLVGGAITRRVAVEFAGQGEPGLRESVRFAVREFPFTFGAPLISTIGIGLLLVMGRVVAWLGRIPGIGESITSILWGVLLLFSLVMALIVLGVAIAWPLMVCAHSVEGTDGFDALNRAYNYVFVRPWYALWLVLLTMLYGSVLIYFVVALTGTVVHLTEWVAAGPIDDAGLARISADAPDLVSFRPGPRGETRPAATVLGGLWYRGLATLLTAFVYSFFWTAATIIYFLLRKSVDAYDLDRVYLPKPMPQPPKDEPPLVGIAAVERREAQTGSDVATGSSPLPSEGSPAPDQ
jgi:hypothetical protein